MMKIAVVLAVVLLSSQASANNGWTKEDRTTFMSGCIEDAPTRLNEQQVLQQCSCWVVAFENAFTTDELQEALDRGDPRIKRVVDECTKTTAVYQR